MEDKSYLGCRDTICPGTGLQVAYHIMSFSLNVLIGASQWVDLDSRAHSQDRCEKWLLYTRPEQEAPGPTDLTS